MDRSTRASTVASGPNRTTTQRVPASSRYGYQTHSTTSASTARMPSIVELPKKRQPSIWSNQTVRTASKTPMTSVPETTAMVAECQTVTETRHRISSNLVELQAASTVPFPSVRNVPYQTAKRSNLGASPPSAAAISRTSNYQERPSLVFNKRQLAYTQTGNGGFIRFPKDAFKPGVIFRAALHEEDFMGAANGSEVTQADSNRSETKYGPVYTKQRKMIVVAMHQDHYIAVPLYTHNGKGLSKKGKPDEYVSIRDHRTPGPFTKLSIHAPLVTEYINSGIRLYDPRSSAHLAYPVSRKYTLPVVPEGCLDKTSIKDLLRLYQNYASNADIVQER